MNFSEKLQELRKSKGLSQEALAQKLDVSRQAVSKWETGEGYPEMDKLLLLSDLFQVSLDYLLKNEANQVNTQQEKYFMSSSQIQEFVVFKNAFAYRIAIAVMVIILSVNLPILFESMNRDSLGVVLMLVVIALAVTVLIVTGISSEKYSDIEKTEIQMSTNDLQNLQSQYATFRSRFGLIIGLGVCLIILSVAGVIMISEFIGEDNILAPIQLLCCVAFSVFLFIVVGIKDSMYRFLTDNKKYIEKQQEEANSIWGITMPLAAMVYLIMGFTKNWWHPGWIVFPVAAILTMGIESMMKKGQ